LGVKGIALFLVGSIAVVSAGAAGADAAVTHRWVAALKGGGFLGDVSGAVILYPSLSYRLHPRHAIGLGAALEYWKYAPEEYAVVVKVEYRARPFEADPDIGVYVRAGNAMRLPEGYVFGVYTAAAGIGKEYRVSDKLAFSFELGTRAIIAGIAAGVAWEGTLGISN
jgi:hypothetical protein